MSSAELEEVDAEPDIPPEAEDEPLVELDGATVDFTVGTSFNPFADPDTVNAVNEVDLAIEEQDVLILVGESGSGKTTLGKVATALQRPTDGEVRYRGQNIWEARDGTGLIDIDFRDIRRALQIIHQDPVAALNPNRTILQTLAQPLRIRFGEDMGPGSRRERVYNVLEQVNLTPAADYGSRYPHQLSGGEKQRVVLTRALLMDPDLILADEPVSALDVSLRVEIMDLMLELQEVFGMSYIFVSHNLSNARYFAEKAGGRVGIMYLGELVEIGTPQEVIGNPKHPYTQVLKWATPSLAPDEEEKGSPPLRAIDIPDARNPPSGCRFHTRCPFAREACTEIHPELEETTTGGPEVACFRPDGNHEYWQTPLLDEEAAQIAEEKMEVNVE